MEKSLAFGCSRCSRALAIQTSSASFNGDLVVAVIFASLPHIEVYSLLPCILELSRGFAVHGNLLSVNFYLFKRQRVLRKNFVTRFISTRRAAGSLTPCPRPGKGSTSTYFPASMRPLITASVLAKCTLSSPVPWAISSLPLSCAAYFTGEES